MSKIIAILFMLAMSVQVIRPFGFPGLRKRMDFWKIAVAALLVIMIASTIRP